MTLEAPPEFAIQGALMASLDSPCQSKRGAAIFRSGFRLISTGYNHIPKPYHCDGSDDCKAHCRETAVHAEEYALVSAGIVKAAGADVVHVKSIEGKPVEGGIPSCLRCATLMLASHIGNVYLLEPGGWRKYPAAEFYGRSLMAHGLDNVVNIKNR